MFLYLVYIVFLITVAMAAAGVILSVKLQKRYDHEIFGPLLYYQVFIYTFGFYGIWGQVLIRAFLPAYVSADIIGRFYDIALLLGLPFIIFAWLMLLQFSSVIYSKRRNNWFVFGFLLINIIAIIIIGFLAGKAEIKPLNLIKHYFIVMNFVYTAIASLQIYYGEKGSFLINITERRITAAGTFLLMSLQSAILLIFSSQAYIGILFILIFFAGNTFLPVFMTYGTSLNTASSIPLHDLSFNDFCSRYEVSPRESDIVREICKGLSNKEISEKLFISLQTVKDHSHRIYIKTNVKSRAQLMNLVREVVGK